MASLEYLRRKVQTRIRDFDRKLVQPAEIDAILNEAQDRFTKETDYVLSTLIVDIVADQALYELSTPGYKIGRIQTVKVYDGSTDSWVVLPVSVEKLDALDSDWRNRTSARPWYYVRNYTPSTSLSVKGASIWLYPTPTTTYSSGLRITTSLITDNALVADGSESVVGEWDEALVNYAVAEAMIRCALQKDPEVAKTYMGQAEIYRRRFEEDLLNAAVKGKTGYDRAFGTTKTQFQ